METQTALAIPDEDNSMVVYSSNQCPEYAHVTIAKCLGIPEHNVRVITRRVGGGFGGKAMKAIPVSFILNKSLHVLKFRQLNQVLASIPNLVMFCFLGPVLLCLVLLVLNFLEML